MQTLKHQYICSSFSSSQTQSTTGRFHDSSPSATTFRNRIQDAPSLVWVAASRFAQLAHTLHNNNSNFQKLCHYVTHTSSRGGAKMFLLKFLIERIRCTQPGAAQETGLYPNPNRAVLQRSNSPFTEGMNIPSSSNSRIKRGRKVSHNLRGKGTCCPFGNPSNFGS